MWNIRLKSAMPTSNSNPPSFLEAIEGAKGRLRSQIRGGSEVDKRAGLKRKLEVGGAGFFPGEILWLSAFVGSNPALRTLYKL